MDGDDARQAEDAVTDAAPSEPEEGEHAWFEWERLRRMVSHLQVTVEQLGVISRWLTEAVHAAEPPSRPRHVKPNDEDKPIDQSIKETNT